MASLLAFSLICLALLTVMIGIASLGLVLFVILRDALFPLPTSDIAHAQSHFYPQFTESKSSYLDGKNEHHERNHQIYPLNSDDIIDLDDNGLHKMQQQQQKRSLRSVSDQSNVQVSSIATEESAGEMQLEAATTAVICDDEEHLESHSEPNEYDNSPTTPSSSSSPSNNNNNNNINENHWNKDGSETLAAEKSDSIEHLVDSESDPEKHLAKREQSEEMAVEEQQQQPQDGSTEAATKPETVVTEVTLTIEPPFERIILQPLCPVNGEHGC